MPAPKVKVAGCSDLHTCFRGGERSEFFLSKLRAMSSEKAAEKPVKIIIAAKVINLLDLIELFDFLCLRNITLSLNF